MMTTSETQAEIAASHGHEYDCFDFAIEVLVEDIAEQGFDGNGEYEDIWQARELHMILGERLATGEIECRCPPSAADDEA